MNRRLHLLWLFAAPPLSLLNAEARGTVEYVRTIPSVREFTKPRGFW
jgi:hypothetical protein